MMNERFKSVVLDFLNGAVGTKLAPEVLKNMVEESPEFDDFLVQRLNKANERMINDAQNYRGCYELG